MKQPSKNIAENSSGSYSLKKAFQDNSEISLFLDFNEGMNYSLNDEEIYLELLKAYVVNNRINELENTYSNKDWNNYIIAIHTVKSNTKTIGGIELSDRAKELEYAAKSGNYEIINEKHRDVFNDYKKLIELIKEIIST